MITVVETEDVPTVMGKKPQPLRQLWQLIEVKIQRKGRIAEVVFHRLMTGVGNMRCVQTTAKR
jgi:hypothetical protein